MYDIGPTEVRSVGIQYNMVLISASAQVFDIGPAAVRSVGIKIIWFLFQLQHTSIIMTLVRQRSGSWVFRILWVLFKLQHTSVWHWSSSSPVSGYSEFYGSYLSFSTRVYDIGSNSGPDSGYSEFYGS